MVFIEKLDNGITVVAEQMSHYKSVSIGAWINAGSIREQSEHSGASHFIEHMLFKGTSNRTSSEIAAQMDDIGATLNAFTAKECTCYYAKVLGEHLEHAVDILSDILQNSLFDEKDIEKEKGVICEEILMTEDSPEDIAHDAICETYFKGDSLAQPILGTQESVRSFTYMSLKDYMHEHYLSEDIIIAAAGNFTREKLMEVLNAGFSNYKLRGKNKPVNNMHLSGRRFKVVEKDIEQAHICFALPGCALEANGQYPLFVLNNALGGSMSSRLFQKIREERGLAYSTYSYPSAYRQLGYYVLYAGTGASNASGVAQLMLDELINIKRDGLTQEEFTRSKEQLKGSYLLGQESTSARMNAIGKSLMLLGKIYTQQEIISKIENVNMDDIKAVIDNVLNLDDLCGVFVGKASPQSKLIEDKLLDFNM